MSNLEEVVTENQDEDNAQNVIGAAIMYILKDFLKSCIQVGNL